MKSLENQMSSLVLEKHMVKTAAQMWGIAQRFIYSGRNDLEGQMTLDRCRVADKTTGAGLIFTLDVGAHSSGWWKNPQFERCFHLSISSLAAVYSRSHTLEVVPEMTKQTREDWVKAFFGENVSKIWIEPPMSLEGRLNEVWHYRLFVDEHLAAIVPQGEVYSREFTESGWKSWSELKGGT